MRKIFVALWVLGNFALVSAQRDSIYIKATVSEDLKTIQVRQEINFVNKSETPMQDIRLLNWVAAYQNRGTALYEREIEDRNREFHFAKPEELGTLNSLMISIDGKTSEEPKKLNSENLYFSFSEPLLPGERTKIELQYELKLPSASFTGYGVAEDQVLLKYFFLTPDSFQNLHREEKHFRDMEETSSHSIFWTVNLDVPANHYAKSNLQEIAPYYFRGFLKNDPEILISSRNYPKINIGIDGKKTEVHFGYPLTQEEKEKLEFYLPRQLAFIQKNTGILPENIFISEKFRKKEDFFGNDDIVLWKFRFPLFTPSENIDLDYFSVISQSIINENLITYKEEDHWLKNGIKTYLELDYLKTHYPEHKLLGMLPEASIFGIKPLKIFHASRLKLIERYGIAYRYMMTENLDQKIGEEFSDLSNFNETVISKFETGSLFNFVAEKMGTEKFHDFLRQYFSENSNRPIDTDDFLKQLAYSSNNSSAFLANLIEKKHRVNFKIKNFRRDDGKLLVKVKKDTADPVPFKLETISKDGQTNTHWFETPPAPSEEYYEVPESDAHKLVINSGHFFPESKFRDNYLYTKGFFSNTKKIRLKILKDIPNPEYNEIYLEPRLKFNAYDNVLFGLNFRNESLFRSKLAYSVTPYYSSGTGKLTGSAGTSYTFLPPESFFRNIILGVNGSYFHYDYHLAYQQYSAFTMFNFAKEPRSAIDRGISFSYNYYFRDLTPQMILENEYQKYNLWNLNYRYVDNSLIHEKSFGTAFQMMEDFQKVSAEAFYRYEFAPHKKISFRLFGGYFLSNNTRNDIFDFGISKVSNYSFSYGLLGQSATSGILSQQFVLADGGFKSLIDTTANQWIGSLNVDSHVWKMFHVYADAGMYKNKGSDPKFIWDSGVKVRIIPDFLEIYLPVYSTLGFEPSFKDYASRIRFTLVMNLGAVVNTFRRGWY